MGIIFAKRIKKHLKQMYDRRLDVMDVVLSTNDGVFFEEQSTAYGYSER